MLRNTQGAAYISSASLYHLVLDFIMFDELCIKNMQSEIYYIFLIFFCFQTNIVAIENTMPNLTNMYQNVERENQNSFSSSRKASSKRVRKLEKTTVQIIELKNDDIDIDETIHEENPYGDFYVNDETLSDIAVSNFEKIIEEKSKNYDDGFKKEYAVRIRRLIIDIC